MSEGQPDPPTGLIARALVLVVLIAAADLWVRHHLGWPLGNPAALAALMTVVGAATALVDRVFGKSVLQTVYGRVASLVRARVSWTTLAVLLLVQLLVATSCSSVVVIPEQPGDAGSVVVTPADAPKRSAQRALDRDHPIARVPVSTTPFGRTFIVAAKGYVPTPFTVYPLSGRRVRLATDVPRVPTLLFRPSALALGLLADGAVFRVLHVDDRGGSTTIAADSSGTGASFRIGPPHTITGDMLEGWRLELMAEDADAASMANVIRRWRVPVVLEHADLPLRGRLHAEVVMSGTVVASADVELGAGRLLDVVLVDNPDVESP